MATVRSLVVIQHDTGYGDGLLMHINHAISGKDMIAERVVPNSNGYKERGEAIESLQRLFNFALNEEQIALRHRDNCKEFEDYRAMDRHEAYAIAMLKMQHQIRAYASNVFHYSVYDGKLKDTK
jgi:hypothetical protein